MFILLIFRHYVRYEMCCYSFLCAMRDKLSLVFLNFKAHTHIARVRERHQNRKDSTFINFVHVNITCSCICFLSSNSEQGRRCRMKWLFPTYDFHSIIAFEKFDMFSCLTLSMLRCRSEEF